MSLESVAIITIRRPNKMTKKGRRQIADWMRKQASNLIRYGDKLSTRFTARYLYDAKR